MRYRSSHVPAAFALFIVTLMPAPSLAEDDHCKDVLSRGIFDVLKIHDESKIAEEFKSFLMTKDVETVNKAVDAGLDLTVPLKKIPVPLQVGAAYTQLDERQLAKLRQEWKEQSITKEELYSRLERTANRDIVAAWRECMQNRNRKQGVVLEAREEGGVIIADIEYRAPGGEKFVINEWLPFGAEQVGKWTPQEVPAHTTKTVHFKRTDKDAPVVVTVDTNKGHYTYVLRSPPPPPDAPVAVQVQVKAIRIFSATTPLATIVGATPHLKLVVDADGQPAEEKIVKMTLTNEKGLKTTNATNWLASIKVPAGGNLRMRLLLDDAPGQERDKEKGNATLIDVPVGTIEFGRMSGAFEGDFTIRDPIGGFECEGQVVYRIVKQ